MPGNLPVVPAEDWAAHQDETYRTTTADASARIDATAQQQASQEAEKQARQQAADAAWAQQTQAASSRIDAAIQTRQQTADQSWQQQTQAASARIDAAMQARQAAAAAPSSPSQYPGDQGSAPPGGSAVSSNPPGGGELQDYARAAAIKAGIDPEIFVRQIQQESGFNPNARNPSGATGIAQIVPSAHPGVDPTDPHASLDYAANWMAQLTKQYGGDKAKALAAYNAGPGNVEKYGGVPPFEETQRYVRTILGPQNGGDALGADSPAPSGRNADSPHFDAAGGRSRVEAVGQFEQGLPYEEAAAICGPVAALAFAQANGRNPDLGEARRLAKQRGWTSQGGMNGIQNEQATLTDMGVASKLDLSPDFGHIAQDAANGNPVIISTGVHYYYASAYDKATGKLYVGKTGEARKGGGSWMSPQQIATLDGGINGALFVDNPQSPAPSVGAQPGTGGDIGGDTSGDRPLSEFSPASADPDASVLPAWKRLDPNRPSDDTGMPFPKLPSPGDVVGGAFTTLGRGAQAMRAGIGAPADATERALGSQALGLPLVGAKRIVDQFRQGPPVSTAYPGDTGSAPPPSLPDQIGGAFDRSQAPYQTMQSDLVAHDPTGGYVAGGVNAATNLISDPLVAAGGLGGLGGKIGIATTVGGGVAGGVAAAFTPPTREPWMSDETYARLVRDHAASYVEGGAGLGSMAGIPASMVAPAVGRALERAAPVVRGAVSDLATGAREMGAAATEAGIVPGATIRDASGDATRMYHGTGSAFDKPNAATFDPHGTFGPGYYLTDSPSVAEGFAMSRSETRDAAEASLASLRQQLHAADPALRQSLERDIARIEGAVEQMPGGPNIRAVDVPANLNLFDAGNKVDDATAARVRDALATDLGLDPLADRATLTRMGFWRGIVGDSGHGGNLWRNVRDILGGDTAKTNEFFRKLGYDGITFDGGRYGLDAADGSPVQNAATVVFPESLAKLTNAISGTQGGSAQIGPAIHLAGAVAGGVAGNAVTDPNASPLERAGNIAAGAATGFGLTAGASGEGRAMLRDVGARAKGAGLVPGLSTDTPGSRFYHGTGSAFDRPSPGKFDNDGLFGPGYYLTSDARVADSYARTRAIDGSDTLKRVHSVEHDITRAEQGLESAKAAGNAGDIADWEDQLGALHDQRAEMVQHLPGTGPNLRAVDVPEGLRLLDADQAMSTDDAKRLLGDAMGLDPNALWVRNEVDRLRGSGDTVDGASIYESLAAGNGKDGANEMLANAGYDGVKYAGGQRIPMNDAAGKAIEHQAVAIFPESLAKLTNAISGTQGGSAQIAPAVHLAGAVGGGAAGYATARDQLPGESDADYKLYLAGRIGTGLASGATLVAAATSPALRQSVREIGGARTELGIGGMGPTSGHEPTPEDFSAFMQARKDAAAGGERYTPPTGPAAKTSISDMEAFYAKQEAAARHAEPPQNRLIGDPTSPDAPLPEYTGDAGIEGLPSPLQAAGADALTWKRVPQAAGGTGDAVIVNGLKGGKSVLGRVVPIADLEGTVGPEAAQAIRDATGTHGTIAGLGLRDPGRAAPELGPGVQQGVLTGANPNDYARGPEHVGRPSGLDEAASRLGRDPQVVQTDLLKAIGVTTPATVATRIRDSSNWLRDIRMGSMLSSVQSWPRIVAGTAINVPIKLIGDYGGAVVRRDLNQLKGANAEWGAAYNALGPAISDALHAIRTGVSLESSEVSGLQGAGAINHTTPILGGIANASQLPVRAHIAIQDAYATIFRTMEGTRWAATDAARAGLDGTEAAAHVADLIAHPPAAMVAAMEQVARASTFRSEMGAVGQALARVQRWPYVGQFLAPMVKIPYNVAARGLDMTPIGAVGTAIDVARGAYKNGAVPGGALPLQQRATLNALGGILTTGGMYAASQGILTGAGPDDPKKLAAMRAQGWQPYSMLIGGVWVPTGAFGAAGFPLRMAADTYESYAYGRPLGAAIQKTGLGFIEQTPLKDMLDLALSLHDPRVEARTIESLASTFVPFGGTLRNIGQATDSVVRDAKGPVDAVKGVIPGLRQTLPSRQDVLGRNVPEPHTGLDALNPFTRGEERPNQTLATLEAAGLSVPPTPRTLQGVVLTPNEQRLYRTIRGEQITNRVEAVASAVDSLDPATAKKVLQSAVTQADATALALFMSQIDRADFAQRRIEAVTAPVAAKRR